MRVSPSEIAARAWRRGIRLAARSGSRPAILMYHRIGSPPFDPWGLSVSPDRFRDQLEALVTRRAVLSMDALVAALGAGEAPRFATAITFDDGYADNFTLAKPMLEAMRVPATVFLTTGAIGSARPFWWDELGDLVFRTRSAAAFDLTAGRARLAASWQACEAVPDRLQGWRTAHGPRCDRTAAYLALWRELQCLPARVREQAMDALRARLGPPDIACEDDARIMSAEMAARLASEVVAVGGHARNHVPLTALSAREAEGEIADCRSDVEALAGAPPTGFAYPHGEHDEAIAGMVEDRGFAWAVTTRQDTVGPGRSNRYALPRIAVGRWTGTELIRKIAWRGG